MTTTYTDFTGRSDSLRAVDFFVPKQRESTLTSMFLQLTARLVSDDVRLERLLCEVIGTHLGTQLSIFSGRGAAPN